MIYIYRTLRGVESLHMPVLYMGRVDTVISNPLHRVVTLKDELWPLPWWPTFSSWMSRSSINSNIPQGCFLLWVMWLTTVNLDYKAPLWEAHFTWTACGSGAEQCVLRPPVARSPKSTMHNTNVGHYNLAAATLLWYFIYCFEPNVAQSAPADVSTH